jgi:hypothetical protein
MLSSPRPKVCHGFLVSPFDGEAMNIELLDGTLIKGVLQDPRKGRRNSLEGPSTPTPSPSTPTPSPPLSSSLKSTISQGNLRLLSLLSDDGEYDEEMGYASSLHERPVRVTVILNGPDFKHRQLVEMFDADGECVNWILSREGYVDMLF